MTKALEYARACVRKDNKRVPKYVKKQCRDFIKIATDKDKKYCINPEKVTVIENITKLLIMPEGPKAGQSMYACMIGYQWLLIIAAFCVVHRSKPTKRRYTNIILEIGRKNYKTYTIAICFIILFLTEPKFSEFYSVAPDGYLSREVKKKVEKTIKASPLLYLHNFKPRFNLYRDSIEFKLTESKYIPLNYSTSRLDGRYPAAFLADEVAELPNNYAIEAMRSGQLNILDPLGFIISTKYKRLNNPFEDEVAFAKAILDGIVDRETTFALLFEPDKTKDWMTDDNIIYQANPAAVDNPEIFEKLRTQREDAILREALRENFLTKHLNIIYQGVGTESYIDVQDLVECRVPEIDWTGREVYVGVDLSISIDNCSVVMVAADDDDNILIQPMAFFPEGKIEEKTKEEQLNYQDYVLNGQAIACGDRVVDYAVIEDYVFSLEEKYGVAILGIGYDRMNGMSSAQKWDKVYQTTMVRQHSDTLHEPTKLLLEKVLKREVRYVKNELYEINFENARCVEDTNLNKYVHKKKSRGKVDMVMATLNAVYLLNQEVFLSGDDFGAQVI